MIRRLPLIFALLLALPAGTGLAAGEETQLKKSTQDLQQLRSRIQSLDKELARDRGQRDQLLQKIEASETQLETLESRLQAQRLATGKQAALLRKTQAERQRVEQQLAAERQQLGRQIRAAYVSGRGGPAKLMLQQTEPARLTRLLTYFDYLNRARTRVIDGARQKSQALLEIESRQQREMEQLAAAHAQQELTLSQLGNARAERLAAVARLRDRISGGENRLQELRAGEREIETLVTRLREVLAELSSGFRSDQPLARQKGKLPWPLRGKLLARFGAPKADGKLKWAGLWIAAREGTPVRVVANGRVAYVGRMQRFGLLAVVEHGDGYYTLYGHNGSVEKATGDTVKAGEVLARAGASGGHDDSGLYFELRKGSQPVNPMEWLAR